MRPAIVSALPIGKLLALAGVLLLLLHLASAPGCTTNVATIVNNSGNTVEVTLKNNAIVVWRGKVARGDTVKASYRMVAEGEIKMEAVLAAGSVESNGSYVTRRWNGAELFVIEKDSITMDLDRGLWRQIVALHGPATCAVQYVLDLTGVPDPASLR